MYFLDKDDTKLISCLNKIKPKKDEIDAISQHLSDLIEKREELERDLYENPNSNANDKSAPVKHHISLYGTSDSITYTNDLISSITKYKYIKGILNIAIEECEQMIQDHMNEIKGELYEWYSKDDIEEVM